MFVLTPEKDIQNETAMRYISHIRLAKLKCVTRPHVADSTLGWGHRSRSRGKSIS